jgi:glucose/arabinose dehydrogenase
VRPALTSLVAPTILTLAAVLSSAAPSPVYAQLTLPDGFSDELVADALSEPVGITFLSGGRLLIIERSVGRIRLQVGGPGSPHVAVGTVPSVSTGGERGLLGIAVDPRWPASPYLYVHQTRTGSVISISRFTASGDLAGLTNGEFTIDPASRYDLVNDIPDAANNHNGGTVRFGLDGMLYVSLGEDATACAAQDSVSLRGVILRLDVTRLPVGPGAAPGALVAAVGNPFATSPDSNARLVWEYGLRNPFRFQVDPQNGELWIGDVGQSAWEELDRAPAGGLDFGWPYREGPSNLTSGCSGRVRPALTEPVFAYDRTGAGFGSGASIISGGRYRAPAGATQPFPTAYAGNVFVSDFFAGYCWRLTGSGNSWAIASPVPGQPTGEHWGEGFSGISDYTIGPDGSLYYSDMTAGQVHRIRAAVGPGPTPSPQPIAVLRPAYPLPAKDAVHLEFALSSAARVTLTVHDLRGRRVRELIPPTDLGVGSYTPSWDGYDDTRRLAESGLYFARFTAGSETHEWRIVISR